MPIHLGAVPRSSSPFPGMSAHSCPSHRHCNGYGIVGELGSLYSQHSRLQIDIDVAQSHGLRNTKSSGGDQTEQRLIGCSSKARRRAKAARRSEQLSDLLFMVDMWGQSLANGTKD